MNKDEQPGRWAGATRRCAPVPKQIGGPLVGGVENASGLAVRGEQLHVGERPLADILDGRSGAAGSGWDSAGRVWAEQTDPMGQTRWPWASFVIL